MASLNNEMNLWMENITKELKCMGLTLLRTNIQTPIGGGLVKVFVMDVYPKNPTEIPSLSHPSYKIKDKALKAYLVVRSINKHKDLKLLCSHDARKKSKNFMDAWLTKERSQFEEEGPKR